MSSFGQGLWEELKRTGISLTILHPGATATEFYSRAGMDDTEFGTTHDMALSAGVALAVLARHDGASSQTCEEILTSIEPSSLSPSASILYEYLDSGTAEPPDISSTDAPPEDLPLQTLERQAVAHLLDQLES